MNKVWVKMEIMENSINHWENKTTYSKLWDKMKALVVSMFLELYDYKQTKIKPNSTSEIEIIYNRKK